MKKIQIKSIVIAVLVFSFASIVFVLYRYSAGYKISDISDVSIRAEDAEKKLRFDEPFDRERKIEFNRSIDLKKMWNLVPISGRGSNGGNEIVYVVPTSAINAAKRSIDALRPELIGKTIEQAFVILRRPNINEKYQYNFPFVDGKGTFMMRFDNGHFGFEYYAILDDELKIKSIKEEGIW